MAFRGRWNIVDHACRHCMGRVLSGESKEGVPVVHCAECGAEEFGDHEALCFCNVKMPDGSRLFECFVPEPDPNVVPGPQVRVRERASS